METTLDLKMTNKFLRASVSNGHPQERLTISLKTNPQHVEALNSAVIAAQKYFCKREPVLNADSIGASGSMFRVFRGIDKPSAHYKNWAFDQVRSSQFERDV